MPRFDYPLDALRSYAPEVDEPADFDAFWSETLTLSRALSRRPSITRVESSLSAFEVFDVRFSGFGGDEVAGWLLLPAGSTGPLPAVVEYNGYGGGRGRPHERLSWVAAGYAYFFMDTRGQGSAWGSGGITADPHGTGASFPGFLTRGILNPADYYYRRVFADAVLAIDAVRGLDAVDADRVAVCGGSQGGGIAIAVAGLVDGLVGTMPDVPFLCHFHRAVGLTGRDPYEEVARFLAVHRDAGPQVFRTLSYFDGVNFAKRAKAPALFSVGLMDQISPPSTVFAAHNHWAVASDILEYPFNEHEGGQPLHWETQAVWLAGLASLS